MFYLLIAQCAVADDNVVQSGCDNDDIYIIVK